MLAPWTYQVDGWPDATTQVGDELARLLPLFGGVVSRSDGALTVDGGAGIRGGAHWAGVDLDLSTAGELTPTLAGLAALASSPSRITGVAHLRGHETDRLAALKAQLEAIGASVSELDDGLEIIPGALHGAAWNSYEDHRMATTGALLGLAVAGIAVDDIGTTAKTLPEFPQLWAAMLGAVPKGSDISGLLLP